jgi:hypothetical protein
MSRIFNPVYSSTSDGSDITLCRILEAAGSIKDAIAGGGGGGATSANPAVGPDGVTRVPLSVNSDGELKVNVEASVDADLAQIESQLNTIIGIETPQAADVANINTNTASIAGLQIPPYNYVSCSYTGSNLTGVVYKTGGSGGTTVATLTLTYDGSNNLTSVTKS